jgi:hypothetical protein
MKGVLISAGVFVVLIGILGIVVIVSFASVGGF